MMRQDGDTTPAAQGESADSSSPPRSRTPEAREDPMGGADPLPPDAVTSEAQGPEAPSAMMEQEGGDDAPPGGPLAPAFTMRQKDYAAEAEARGEVPTWDSAGSSPESPLSPPLAGPPNPAAKSVEDEVREFLGQFPPPPSQPLTLDLDVGTALLVRLDSEEAHREKAIAIATEMAEVLQCAQETHESAMEAAMDAMESILRAVEAAVSAKEAETEAGKVAVHDPSVQESEGRARPDRSLKWIKGEARTLPRPLGLAKRVTFADQTKETEEEDPDPKPVQPVSPTVRPRREPSAITLPTVLHPRIVPIVSEERSPQEWDSPSAAAIVERPRGAAPTPDLPRPMLRQDDGYRRHRYNPRRQPTVEDYEPLSLPRTREPSPEPGAPVQRTTASASALSPREEALQEETARLQRKCQRQEALDSPQEAIREAIRAQHRRMEELHSRAAQERRKADQVHQAQNPQRRPDEPLSPQEKPEPVEKSPEERAAEERRREAFWQWRWTIQEMGLPPPLVPDCPRSPDRPAHPLPARTNGLMFGGLAPIPRDRHLDPPPYGCYNCWRSDHKRQQCPYPAYDAFCLNCGRRDVTLCTCPRCGDAHRRWTLEKFGQRGRCCARADATPGPAAPEPVQPSRQEERLVVPTPATPPAAAREPVRTPPQPPADHQLQGDSPGDDALNELLRRLEGCSPAYIQWAIRRQFGGSKSPPPTQ